MTIRKVDDVFVISSRGTWVPGCYESERAANYAFRFDDQVLHRLQDTANQRAGGTGGTITFEDLQVARKNSVAK